MTVFISSKRTPPPPVTKQEFQGLAEGLVLQQLYTDG